MAVKGYINSEAAFYRQRKLIRLTILMGATHLLLMVANILLALTSYSIIAIVGVVIYLSLYGIYVHGADLLTELGYEKNRPFRAFKIISPVAYFLTFVIAILS